MKTDEIFILKLSNNMRRMKEKITGLILKIDVM